MVPGSSPESENAVDAEPVLDIMVENVTPSVDLSILYPVIAEPPTSAGAVQERLICDEETALAERFVGGPSTSWALAGVASMPNDNNKRNAKIPVSRFILLIFFTVLPFNIVYLIFLFSGILYR